MYGQYSDTKGKNKVYHKRYNNCGILFMGNDRASLSERQILKQILDYLNKHPKVAFAYRQNTGCMSKKYTDKLGRTKTHYVRFSFPGASDIIGMLKDGSFLAIEVKGNEGVVSAKQLAFLDMVNKDKGLGILAYSLDDVMEKI